MNTLDSEFRLDIPQTMNLDTFAAHFFNSAPSDDSSAAADDLSQSVHLLNATGRATITSVADLHQHQTSHLNTINRSASVGNQFFQKIGETLFGFGGGSPAIGHNSIRVSNSEISSGSGHNMDLLRNHIVIDSSDFGTAATTSVAAAAANELQQQLEYDKFMNEIWIGIVLTLIIISMVFCICSCFLYHQFRQWKRNYRHNLQQSQDIESAKLNPDTDDPVPEYTLVSGLPSYEAALELMQKSTVRNNGNNNGSCLIVYPSALFGAFMVNEKESLLMSKAQLVDTHQDLSTSSSTTTTATDATIPQSPISGGTATTSLRTPIPLTENVKCQNVPRMALQQYSIPSYEEAMGCQPQPQQQQQLQPQQQFQTSDTSDTMTRTCVIKSPPPPAVSHPIWSNEDMSKVLLTEKKKDDK